LPPALRRSSSSPAYLSAVGFWIGPGHTRATVIEGFEMEEFGTAIQVIGSSPTIRGVDLSDNAVGVGMWCGPA
jgi:hypothetical protein